MKPELKKQIVIVSTFLLLAFVILVAGVLILGKQRDTFAKTETIRAIFPDVSGLLAGNNVWISGVKVGNVKKVNLYKSSYVEVIMNIEKKSMDCISKDAKAKIISDGLIGNRIVVIYGGSESSPHVRSGDILNVEKTLSTDEMLNTLQENNKNLLAITTTFKGISQKIAEGKGTIGKLLTDETLIKDLQLTASTLKFASAHTQALTANIELLSSNLNKRGSLVNDLITDTSVFEELKTTIKQIQDVSYAANEIAGNVKMMSSNLKNVSDELGKSDGIAGALIHDKDATSILRKTLLNIQSSTEKLNENMEALQHNFLFRGYFRKRAAQENKKVQNASKIVNVP